MKKKIITMAVLGLLLFTSITAVSAIELVNGVETSNEAIGVDTATKVTESFYFCRIESSGRGFCIFNLPILSAIDYTFDDPNATTTIKSFFSLRSFTIKGEHSLTIWYFRGCENLPFPGGFGDFSLNGRALRVDIEYYID